MAENNGRIWDPGWIGTAAIIFVVIAVAWSTQHDVDVHRFSPDWPTCDGVVVESYVRETQRSSDRHWSWSSKSAYWSVQLKYRYQVDGTSYDNSRISAFTPRYGSEAEAAATQAKYPVGAHVTVRYDPKQPGTSVLVPG